MTGTTPRDVSVRSELGASIADVLSAARAALMPIAGKEAELEAQVLLAHALRTDRAHLIARLHERVASAALARCDALLARRLAREPLAYITDHREFYGIDLLCRRGALIPRPETELLVEFAIAAIQERGPEAPVIDVGTGSGAIAIAIACAVPGVRIVATEISDVAREIARENVERCGVAQQVGVVDADLFGDGVYDVVVANLPYVSASEWRSLPPEIRDWEPREALIGGGRGTEVIERLLDEAATHLAAGGVLAAEIGCAQAEHLSAYARSRVADARVRVQKDLAGLDRVLVVHRGG